MVSAFFTGFPGLWLLLVYRCNSASSLRFYSSGCSGRVSVSSIRELNLFLVFQRRENNVSRQTKAVKPNLTALASGRVPPLQNQYLGEKFSISAAALTHWRWDLCDRWGQERMRLKAEGKTDADRRFKRKNWRVKTTWELEIALKQMHQLYNSKCVVSFRSWMTVLFRLWQVSGLLRAHGVLTAASTRLINSPSMQRGRKQPVRNVWRRTKAPLSLCWALCADSVKSFPQ